MPPSSDRADRGEQVGRALAHAARRSGRVDPGAKQRLGDVDVAEAGDAPLIHQERLDRGADTGERRGQRGRVQARQRVRSDARERRRRRKRSSGRNPAEATRIDEAQLVAAREPERDVCVRRARGAGRLDAQPPGHAEVDQHAARIGSPCDACATATRMNLPIRRTPAIARPIATARRPRTSTLRRRCSGWPLHQTDSMRRPRRRGRQPAHDRLDLGQLRHRRRFRCARRLPRGRVVGKGVREAREVRDRQLLGAVRARDAARGEGGGDGVVAELPGRARRAASCAGSRTPA